MLCECAMCNVCVCACVCVHVSVVGEGKFTILMALSVLAHVLPDFLEEVPTPPLLRARVFM